MSDNLGEPDNIEEGSGHQDPIEPIQRTDDTDRNKDGNVENNNNQDEEVEIEKNDDINNRKRKRKDDDETTIGKIKKQICLCGVCNKYVNKGSVKCNGCEKWIHRRNYINKRSKSNKPNCSGLSRNDDYEYGVYKCPKCADPKKTPKKPGRPKLTKSLKSGSQRSYGSMVSKKKINEEIKNIEKMVVEITEEKNKLKTDGRDSNKDKNGNEKSLISCGGANLNQADIDSLENKGLVTDEIILFFMQAILEYMKSQTKERINMVGPSISYWIQAQNDKREIDHQKKEINQKDYDYVFFPINDKDDPEKGDGGSHWSLILYNKKDNTYMYFDPLNGMNIKYAKALHLNLIDTTSYESIDINGRITHVVPPLVEVKCQEQANGYDCGIFIMVYMATIMKNIVEGREVEDYKNVPYKTDELRDLLLAALKAEIDSRKKNLNNHNIIDVMDTMRESVREKAKEEKMRKEKEKKDKENLEKALNSLEKIYTGRGNIQRNSNDEAINQW